jgi:4-amino-4-deoxy-L-arabinose transferase-like glycosyltransferase
VVPAQGAICAVGQSKSDGSNLCNEGATFLGVDRWIVAAVMAALALRLLSLGEAPLWLDETDSATWIRMQWAEVLESFYTGSFDPNQLPLYFVALKLWSGIWGDSPWALRLLSVVFSCATVYLTALLADRLVGRHAARWAGGFAALSPYLLHHAQEARMYPLLGLLAAVSIFYVTRFVQDQSRCLGMGLVLVNVALLLTHYYAVFLVVGELLVLLIVVPRPVDRWLFAGLASGAAAVGIVLIGLLLTPRASGEIYEIGFFAVPGVGWSLLAGYTLLPSSEDLHAHGMQAVMPFMPIALAAIAPLVLVLFNGLRAMSSTTRVVVLVILGSVFAGPFAAHLVFPGISLNPRYFMAGEPLFLVTLAAGAASNLVPRRLTALSAALLLLVMVAGSVRHLLEPGHGREDMYAVGDWLEASVAHDQEILITSSEMAKLARFHWPHRSLRIYPDTAIVVDADNVDAVAEQAPISPTRRSYYVVGRAWLSDPDRLLVDELLARYSPCPGIQVRGIRIYCFSRV